jgi:AcrR family transcriptional regulator
MKRSGYNATMRRHRPPSRHAGLSARERILEAAHDAFQRNGIRATGLERIIDAAGVTKATFHRHFPTKNDLVMAFLEARHESWMRWFVAELAKHRDGAHPGIMAVPPTVAEWFYTSDYYGLAFINALVEVGGVVPGTAEIARRHKNEMTDAIAAMLPPSRNSRELAEAAALAISAAIVRAHVEGTHAPALKALRWTLKALATAHPPTDLRHRIRRRGSGSRRAQR